MWSGECETSKLGSSTIYQRQKGNAALVSIGVIALIICFAPIIFTCYQRRKTAIESSGDRDVEDQIGQLDDFDLKSRMSQANTQATTIGGAKTIAYTVMTGAAETKGNFGM